MGEPGLEARAAFLVGGPSACPLLVLAGSWPSGGAGLCQLLCLEVAVGSGSP